MLYARQKLLKVLRSKKSLKYVYTLLYIPLYKERAYVLIC